MNVEVDPAASAEVLEAAELYQKRVPGLGADVSDAFEQGVRQIVLNPRAWHPLGRGWRRYRLTQFPYGIVYLVRNETIFVAAFAHHSRRPRYWRDRLRQR